MEESWWRNPSWVAIEMVKMGVIVVVLQGMSRDKFGELVLNFASSPLCGNIVIFLGRDLPWGRFFSSSYLHVGWEPVQKH